MNLKSAAKVVGLHRLFTGAWFDATLFGAFLLAPRRFHKKKPAELNLQHFKKNRFIAIFLLCLLLSAAALGDFALRRAAANPALKLPSTTLALTAQGKTPAEKRMSGKKADEKPSELSDVGKAAIQYHFDAWTTDNGLPQNSVNSILQTRDGFLWFTTFDGLVRYDGVQFTAFNAGNTKDLKSSRFAQIFEDKAGNLWSTTEDGKLIKYADGKFTYYTRREGLPHDRVLRIREDGDIFFVETAEGIAQWKGDRFAPAPDRPFTGFGYPAQSGAVWYLDSVGLHRVENGRVTTNAAISGLTNHDIKTLYEDRKGELWVGISDGILLRFQNGKFITYAKKDGLPGSRINCILDDRQGNLWVGIGDAGLFRFKDDRFTSYTKADGLTGNVISAIYEDREGILWIGTTAGLNRLRDNIISSYSIGDGLAANNIYPICRDQEGAIWIGSWPGLTKYKDGVFTKYGEQYHLAKELVTALMADREGGLWVGTLGGGAKRFQDGKTISYQTSDGLPDNVVRAICQDRQGAIWFGTQKGLVKYRDERFSVFTTANGLPADSVNLIVEDSQGNLWIGTPLGLGRYRDGVFENYSQQESLSGHIIRAVYEDSEGTIWIGTYDAGLVRLKDGKFTSFTTKDGLFNNGVFQILEDAADNFWISCNLGIYRVSKKELNDYAADKIKSITSIPYGKRDGMLSSECNGGTQPAGVKNADGKLWFPTQGGIAVVDPQAVPVSTQPPPLIIKQFLLNNEPVAFRPAVTISPGVENFEIHYTGLSFIMSERIKFKYKLEGWDTDWVDADTRRVAYYSHVSPGDYTFRVIAANRDGVWNMEGASVQVRIIPPFWKTWWFFSLAIISLIGVVWLGFKFRITQLEKARRAQEAFSQQLISSQENERKRIAAELHDGLGQHLLIIKNSALLGLNMLQQQEQGKERLSDISATASQAIDEVREIAYNLRPYQLDDLGLTKAIEFIIAKVSHSSEVKFSSALDRIDGLFSPESEINLYRIVQESLNNIVKHSGATEAKIVITRNANSVTLTIQDNGRGFNNEATAARERGNGFGLKGISERARMLGARYVVQSAVGQGTTITLSLEAEDGRAKK
jgi:signal transduction histidine kinase/ligand-binding sensor domain-containing protein